MRKIFMLVAAVSLPVLGLTVAPAQASGQAGPNGPSANTPVNPKIVKGKAGEGFFDPSAPGYATADPGVTNFGAQPLTEEAFTPAPYSSLRWATTPEDANGHPWICIGNHIGDAWQDRVNAWEAVADQLTVTYQVGSSACSGWGGNEKIDIEIGIDTARACAYVYKAWNSSGLLTRVIVYHNHGTYACYGLDSTSTDVERASVSHWKTQTIGLGLGNLQFGSSVNLPWGPSVMDMSEYSFATPDPDRGDGLTYDWYN